MPFGIPLGSEEWIPSSYHAVHEDEFEIVFIKRLVSVPVVGRPDVTGDGRGDPGVCIPIAGVGQQRSFVIQQPGEESGVISTCSRGSQTPRYPSQFPPLGLCVLGRAQSTQHVGFLFKRGSPSDSPSCCPLCHLLPSQRTFPSPPSESRALPHASARHPASRSALTGCSEHLQCWPGLAPGSKPWDAACLRLLTLGFCTQNPEFLIAGLRQSLSVVQLPCSGTPWEL